MGRAVPTTTVRRPRWLGRCGSDVDRADRRDGRRVLHWEAPAAEAGVSRRRRWPRAVSLRL